MGLNAEIFLALNQWAASKNLAIAVTVLFAVALVWLMALAVIGPLLFRLRDTLARRAILLTTCSVILAWVGNWVISRLHFVSRPYVTLDGVSRLITEPVTSYSFPSSHAAIAFAMAGAALFSGRKRLGCWMLVAAVLVGVGRVLAGVHYPIDVVAGSALGLFWAGAVFHVFGKGFKSQKTSV